MEKRTLNEAPFSRKVLTAYALFFMSLVLFYKFAIDGIDAGGRVFQEMNQDTILTWYLVLEFIGIVIALMIFGNCYYAFLQEARTRLLFIMIGFLSVGVMDCLHALSYAGSTNLFAEASPYIQVTFWQAGKALLFLFISIASVIPLERKTPWPLRRINGTAFGIVTLVSLIIYSEAVLIDTQNKFVFSSLMILLLQAFGTYHFTRTAVRQKSWLFILFAFGIVMFAFNEVVFIIRGQNYGILSLYANIIKLIAMGAMFRAAFSYNINAPWIQLKEAQEQIKQYASDLERIIDNKTAKIQEANRNLMKEIHYAKEIQQSLLPKSSLLIRNTRFVSRYIPCENLSGDYFDIFKVDDENVGMYILDVSGHGISAALMTMFCINTVKSTERLINRYRGLKPHRNLAHFYEAFNRMNFPEEMHMVIFFATYNFDSRILTYSSGGMNCYPILIKYNGGWSFLDKSKGFPICRCSEFYTPEYYSSKIDLHSGDRIIFYTDGLVEKQKNKALDQEELIRLLESYRHKDIDTLDRYIAERISGARSKLEDDITYFIMEII